MGGSSQVTVTKVKAHATRCAVLEGHVSALDKAANDLADAGAKLAAQQHPSSPEVEKRCERTRLTMTMIAKFLARIHCHVLDNVVDVTPRSQRLKPTRARLATLRIVKQTAHRLVWEQGRWRCARCLRSSVNPCVIRATPCRPGCAHRIFTVRDGCYSLFFCWRCGAYSRRAARLLLRPCRGKPPDKSHGAKSLAAIAACKCPATGASLSVRPLPLSSFFVDDLLPGAGLFGHGRPRLRVKQTC